MAAPARARRSDEDATETPQGLARPAPAPVLGRRFAMTPTMLSALGNQAVTRMVSATTPASRVLARAPKTGAELLELTVAEFDEHRKREQMDWQTATGLSEVGRKAIWEIIDWGLDGLSDIKLRDAAKEIAKGTNVQAIKDYCESLTGTVGGKATVELRKVDTIAKAIKQGKWVATLTRVMGTGTLRAVMPAAVFEDLIDDETVVTALVGYYTSHKPTFQAPTGEDTTAFIQLVRDEKAKISDYTTLTGIRNYHKFPKASLDKLKSDLTTAGKPLTLVFQALHDHNGAFIRHEHVNKVIQNSNIRAYALEGRNEAELRALGTAGIASLAAAYGVDGKITQVLFAGHGNATSMQMGGDDTYTGRYSSGEYAIGEEGRKDLSFAQDDAFWTVFFEALLSNMEAKGGLKPTILLRACLTASNEVDVDKLKEELRKTGTIDVDDPTIDPKTEENQTKIRKGIVDYIKAHGSLAKVAGDKASGRAEVLGAQASISSATTGSIDESTGQLEIVALTDPKVAAPKIEYVRHGKEPLGCIRAVIESWAEDRDRCFSEMRERVKDVVASDDDFIINLLYRTILASYADDILGANAFTDTAHVLSGIARGGAECRVRNLRNDKKSVQHRNDWYAALIGRFSNRLAKVVLYEDWMEADTAKRANFVDALGTPGITRSGVANYLEFDLIGAHVDPILKLSGVSTRGKMLFALVGAITAKNADCMKFLKAQVDGTQAFTKDVTDALGDYSETALRKLVGLPVETIVTAPSSSSSGSAPPGRPQNIQAGAFHVEAMPVTPMRMSKSSVTDWAKLMSAPDDASTMLHRTYFSTTYQVVGKVTDLTGADLGWYMIRQANGTVGYMRTKYF
jgi:hypothetical protein